MFKKFINLFKKDKTPRIIITITRKGISDFDGGLAKFPDISIFGSKLYETEVEVHGAIVDECILNEDGLQLKGKNDDHND